MMVVVAMECINSQAAQQTATSPLGLGPQNATSATDTPEDPLGVMAQEGHHRHTLLLHSRAEY